MDFVLDQFEATVQLISIDSDDFPVGGDKQELI